MTAAEIALRILAHVGGLTIGGHVQIADIGLVSWTRAIEWMETRRTAVYCRVGERIVCQSVELSPTPAYEGTVHGWYSDVRDCDRLRLHLEDTYLTSDIEVVRRLSQKYWLDIPVSIDVMDTDDDACVVVIGRVDHLTERELESRHGQILKRLVEGTGHDP